ncbi:MAG: outer membrane receptor for ferrienterochelin and colicins [Lentimonas sp.]|jgi:outer membrane receptor for ferrienterochelin and colicins
MNLTLYICNSKNNLVLYKTFILSFLFCSILTIGLTQTIEGVVSNGKELLIDAKITIEGQNKGAYTNQDGYFKILDVNAGSYTLNCSYQGISARDQTIVVSSAKIATQADFSFNVNFQEINEVVVSGTLKAVGRLDSPVPVEVYNTCFFRSNPTPSIFESLSNVNGVRPQLNCNICNTGDIHINGLEGPYTMVLIDGMPIVSGLSSVYGLSGIPQALIERVEIVKGPASTLYGSEAVGGIINIITKSPKSAPIVSVDAFASGWGEYSNDLAIKYKMSKKVNALLGVSYFNYSNPIDKNGDGFTDVTLQDRISIFNKFDFARKKNRVFQVAGRYVYEDRWGGQTNWDKSFRGGDSIYAESIYTSRWESFGTYQLPMKEKIMFQFSANGHNQNSYYGTTSYMARQNIGFGQLLWFKEKGRQDWLFGASYRYIFYDDDTPATSSSDINNESINNPSVTHLPGLFVQNDIKITENQRLLVGLRYDNNSIHGHIFSPRANYKWTSQNKRNIVRLSAGNGYRVANVFTEDHAALTGARKVVFASELLPETSYNTNLNFVKQIITKKNYILTFDATAFYTYFNNKILPDYDTDPNLIIYDNLEGHAESKGISMNLDFAIGRNLTINAGSTVMEVVKVENGIKTIQQLTERVTGVWRINYKIEKWDLSFDYTGNLYGPMSLPLLGDLDDRPAKSPLFSIQNVQMTKKIGKSWEIYGGVKNLLNFTPSKLSIARAFDPFDKQVEFDDQGQVKATANNPNALTFDPSYVYASNQGIRGFLGFRFVIK